MRARQETTPSDALRRTLAREGASGAFFPAELPVLVDILLRENQRRVHREGVAIVWGLLWRTTLITIPLGLLSNLLSFVFLGILMMSEPFGASTHALTELLSGGLFVAGLVGVLGLQMRPLLPALRRRPGVPRTDTPDRAPIRSALQRQAHEALVVLLRDRAAAAVTAETLPALARLIAALEHSALADDRALAHLAALALARRLPRLVGAPLDDPHLRRFFRQRLRAAVAKRPGTEPAYDEDFAIATLLALGEAGDRRVARELPRLQTHASDRVRLAADACAQSLTREAA